MNFWPYKNAILCRMMSQIYFIGTLLLLMGVVSCSNMARRPDRGTDSKSNYRSDSVDVDSERSTESSAKNSETNKKIESSGEREHSSDKTSDKDTKDPEEDRRQSRNSNDTQSKNELQSADYEIQSIDSIDPQPKTRYRAIVYLDTVDEVPLKLVIEKIKNPGKKGGNYFLEWSQVVDLDPMVKEVLQRSGPGHKSRDMMTAVSDEALAWSIENLKWNGLDLKFTLKRYPRKTYSCEVKDVSVGNAVAICR